jgi:hypothetical protein
MPLTVENRPVQSSNGRFKASQNHFGLDLSSADLIDYPSSTTWIHHASFYLFPAWPTCRIRRASQNEDPKDENRTEQEDDPNDTQRRWLSGQ